MPYASHKLMTTNSQVIQEIHVELLSSRQRLSDYLIGKIFHIPSRKGVKKEIEKKRVYLNGVVGKTADWVIGGEFIEIFTDTQERTIVRMPRGLKIDLLYEDDYLAFINKPAGIAVSGNYHRTVKNILHAVLSPSIARDRLTHPLPVHRLDAPTSGILLVAKTRTVLVSLSEDFENKRIHKEYLALCMGEMLGAGLLEDNIDGKAAQTYYNSMYVKRSAKYGPISMLKLMPVTGRTHQLRIQLSRVNRPILGDRKYGLENSIVKGYGLFLHARSLQLYHPVTGLHLKIVAPVSRKFQKFIGKQINVEQLSAAVSHTV